MPKMNLKNLIKFSVITIIAVVGLFVFSRGAEAANRYMVGTGDGNTTASWSATSGGAGRRTIKI